MAQVFDTKRRALGKGLESLLPAVRAAAAPVAVEAPAEGGAGAGQGVGWGRPLEIGLMEIERNPLQTRTLFDQVGIEELARSITAVGVVQPVVVQQLPNGRYQLITGERRWLASIEAGRATIPAIIRKATAVQSMEMTIVENLQREDLNPMDQARAFARLMRDFGQTQEQVAERTGKDRASVANFLRLLKLPRSVQQRLEKSELTFGHGRALLALEDERAIERATDQVVKQGMSVRETEMYVQGLLYPERAGGAGGSKAAGPVDPNVRAAEDQLRQALGLKVTIEDRKGRGKVIIEYSGVDDFDAILRLVRE